MTIHFFETFNENKTLCNTKSKNTHSKEKEEVTCKKCKFILESRRLIDLKNKLESEIIANEIRNKKGKI